MSDLVIPGTGSSKFNTTETIDALMQLERRPLERMTTEREDAKTRREVWQDVNRNLTQLRDSAAALFGFQNPFQENLATTSDDRSFTAVATREAGDESRTVQVNRIATADRMLSRPTDREYRVEAGRYTFRVGERDVTLDFAGGTLPEFVESVNRRAGTHVKASILKDTASTNVLLIEALATGSQNKLQFLDKARELAVSVGLIVPTDDRSVTVDLAAMRSTGAAGAVRLQEGELTVSPGGAARIALSPAVTLDKNMVLEMEVRIRDLDRTPWTQPAAPTGPDIRPGDTVEFRGITLRNAPSRMPIPEYTPPEPPVVVDDLNLLSLESRGRTLPLGESAPAPQYRRVRIPIGEMADSANALLVSNPNTYREVSIRDVRIFDVTSRGDARPLNALSQAGDSELTVDGVTVTRPTNVVDDLIPGVTLTLKSPSSSPATLTVAPNTDLIKNRVVEFVGRYNQTLTEIDVVTRRDRSVVDEAYYATDAERQAAVERLGVLAGDTLLSRLKSSLSTLVMNPYPTTAGSELTLLAQMGISTNTGAAGAATLDRTRLRGYLDIDEERLGAVLSNRTEAARQLFGSDTDGDLIVDSGVAYTMNQLLTGYVGRGGVVSQRIGTIDTEIAQRDRQIERENERLEDTEAELKEKYALMEGALQSLEESSKRLESFNQQNR